MGLFNKKNNLAEENLNAMPRLPELPRLPSLPNMEGNFDEDMELPKLPSFPNNSLGDKFSQDTIKEAVAGEKEVEPDEVDDFERNEGQMMPRLPEETVSRRESYSSKQYPRQRKEEPVFIRLDKFEESLEIFKEAKEQISEMEHLLADIKDLKQREETELNHWENHIQEIKNQIEKVDQDIFSKL
jgi:hypothetical protein